MAEEKRVCWVCGGEVNFVAYSLCRYCNSVRSKDRNTFMFVIRAKFGAEQAQKLLEQNQPKDLL